MSTILFRDTCFYLTVITEAIMGVLSFNTCFMIVLQMENADFKLVWKDFVNLLYNGDPNALPRTANLLHTLGSVTVRPITGLLF